MSRARKNFWGRKAAPVVAGPSFHEALAWAVQAAPSPRRGLHFLVKLPPNEMELSFYKGPVWYYLESVTPRSVSDAPGITFPVRYIPLSSPWSTVLGNLADFRHPEDHSVLVIDTYDRKVTGPHSYAQVKSYVARTNPRNRSRSNPGPLVAAATSIAASVGAATWQRLMAMSIEERVAWLRKNERRLGMVGTLGLMPFATRQMEKVGAIRRFRETTFRAVAEAMGDPQIQEMAMDAARAGVAAKKGKAAANPAGPIFFSGSTEGRGRTCPGAGGRSTSWARTTWS